MVMIKAFRNFFGFVFLALVAWAVLPMVFLGFDCPREVVQHLPSPGGGVTALVEEVDCGATTLVTSTIKLQATNESSLVKDCARIYGAWSVQGKPGVALRWEGDGRLVIVFAKAKEALLLASTVEIGGRTVHVDMDQAEAPPQQRTRAGS